MSKFVELSHSGSLSNTRYNQKHKMAPSPIEKTPVSRESFLRALYDLVSGCEGFAVKPAQYLDLGFKLGLHPEVMCDLIRILVLEGVLEYRTAEAVSLTHNGIAEVEGQVEPHTDSSQPSETRAMMKEGVAFTLVTRRGECFNLTLDRKTESSLRIGLLYHFFVDDLVANRNRRLVSVFAPAALRVLVSTYDAQIENAIWNKIRRAFDSGQLTFDGQHDLSKYTELVLQLDDFKQQRPTPDEIQELVKFEAYWLGFRYNPNPRSPISFDHPTDLEYLGVSSNEMKRHVMLLEQRGLLEKVLEGVGRPTLKLIEAVEAASKTTNDHITFARMAIEEARLSVAELDGRQHPMVGVVIVKDGRVLAKAHRGEFPKEHAEFIALEKKLADVSITGATVYATLEPCTTRNHPKVPCAERLAERGVARVFIGMLDPNPAISGKGQMLLSDANIETQLFPHELALQVKELNRNFIREQKQRATPSAISNQPNPQIHIGTSVTPAPVEPNETSIAILNWMRRVRPTGYHEIEKIAAGLNLTMQRTWDELVNLEKEDRVHRTSADQAFKGALWTLDELERLPAQSIRKPEPPSETKVDDNRPRIILERSTAPPHVGSIDGRPVFWIRNIGKRAARFLKFDPVHPHGGNYILQFEMLVVLGANERTAVDYRDGTDLLDRTSLNGLSFLHLFLNDSPLDQVLFYPVRVVFADENGTTEFEDSISFDYDKVSKTFTPRPPINLSGTVE